ncbi:hypothetical protein BU14_0422s0016 [Porphyra umbilicalis]|uniref:non-specific serine/threonine protein kinase n=1 Tax=Porphyra umbilicalis TaxID=2786 RepID=A0A1X6NVD3_PORUM|nr:hypothetical protein BU14_0422s0016 [Porphyra umbilicalis]|eukprot:OSX72584.1 hypothetical protein BU14_0422s0016 [Porphyra umbilicalis]
MGMCANLTVRLVGRLRFKTTSSWRSKTTTDDARVARSASALAIPGLRLVTLGEDGLLRIEMVDGELQLAIRGGSIQAPAGGRRRRVTGRSAAPAGDGDEAGGGGAVREGPAGEPLYVYPGEKGRRSGADGRVQLYFANATERTVWRIALERAVKTLDEMYSVVRSRCLGKGAFSSVVLAFNATSGAACAVKTMDLQELSPREQASIVAEPALLSRLSHPNVLRLVDVFIDPDAGTLAVITGLAAGGSLEAAAKRSAQASGSPAHFTEEAARMIMADILDGLAYLHKEGVVHRDIKPSNIFLTGAVQVAAAGGGAGGPPRPLPATRAPKNVGFTPSLMTLTADEVAGGAGAAGAATPARRTVNAVIGDFGVAAQAWPPDAITDSEGGAADDGDAMSAGGRSSHSSSRGRRGRDERINTPPLGLFLGVDRNGSYESNGSPGGGWPRQLPLGRPAGQAPRRPSIPPRAIGSVELQGGGSSGSGGAGFSPPPALLYDLIGTPPYMAPEMTARDPGGERIGYGRPIDVWAAGATLAWMLVGDEGVASMSSVDMAAALADVSPATVSLLRGLVQPRPGRRLTAATARLHPFFDADVRTAMAGHRHHVPPVTPEAAGARRRPPTLAAVAATAMAARRLAAAAAVPWRAPAPRRTGGGVDGRRPRRPPLVRDLSLNDAPPVRLPNPQAPPRGGSPAANDRPPPPLCCDCRARRDGPAAGGGCGASASDAGLPAGCSPVTSGIQTERSPAVLPADQWPPPQRVQPPPPPRPPVQPPPPPPPPAPRRPVPDDLSAISSVSVADAPAAAGTADRRGDGRRGRPAGGGGLGQGLFRGWRHLGSLLPSRSSAQGGRERGGSHGASGAAAKRGSRAAGELPPAVHPRGEASTAARDARPSLAARQTGAAAGGGHRHSVASGGAGARPSHAGRPGGGGRRHAGAAGAAAGGSSSNHTRGGIAAAHPRGVDPMGGSVGVLPVLAALAVNAIGRVRRRAGGPASAGGEHDGRGARRRGDSHVDGGGSWDGRRDEPLERWENAFVGQLAAGAEGAYGGGASAVVHRGEEQSLLL